jgi:hypothetical protein
MSLERRWLFLTLACCAAAWGQSNTNTPQIGYLYPAGGQTGTVIQIVAGGQFLRGARDVYVSGSGVRASVVEYIRPLRNLQREQRDLIQQRLREVRDKRLAELNGTRRRSKVPTAGRSRQRGAARSEAAKKSEPGTDKVTLPDHPLLRDLDNKSLRELAHIRSVLFFPRSKQQLNRQLAEMVLIEVTIDAGAVPGDRELRLATNAGLTAPVIFQVAQASEVRELEPNDEQAYPDLPNLPAGTRQPQAKPLDLPVVLNGQIMPGDVDRFRFRARQGQRLVMQAHARRLIPYLADAVPGWFQATLALYDEAGAEVAFVDDYRFEPDPVLFYEIARTGEYELEIRDSIYRGREDFVYRVAVSEQPFITRAFPLGGRVDTKTVATVAGWNLPETQLPLDTRGPGQCIRHTAYREGKQLSNSISYAVDTLGECMETEANDGIKDAQRIELPKIVNGRIDKSGDVDVFRFEGRAGDEVVVEVMARRLNSPLDSLVRVTDAAGSVVQWNDDHVSMESYLHKDVIGLVTHHADSYLMTELPQDGTYYVHLADAQQHGGDAYGYRLRISAPQGDFALRVTPSSLYVRAGGIVPLQVHALRRDGFAGPIDVVLRDMPAGFSLAGNRIPADRDRVCMTLTVPGKAPARPTALQLEGRARIDGHTVRRPAVPADDRMQAFLYRHLVPTQELLVVVQKAKWRAPPVELASDSPVRIPAGGSAEVRMKTRRSPALQEMQLELREPPEGLALSGVTVVPEGLAFEVTADADAAVAGLSDNLIVEAFREFTPKQQPGKPAPQKRRYSMGVLPAIPIEIVPR